MPAPALTAATPTRWRLALIGVALAVIGLPLLGAALGGRDLRALFVFPPPLRIPTDYLRFSWAAAAAVAAILVAVAWPWLKARRAQAETASTARARNHRLPMWGVLAIAWTLAWWLLAWTRWEWFAPLQRYTFFPLWLGFIVTMNALVQRRTGSCFMRRHPGAWLGLFAASSACWWTFEWLNRFVENWHYLNAQDFSAAEYAVHATFCFSTVLPAVAAVAEWLGTYPRWQARMAAGPAWPWMARPATAFALAAFGVASLVGTGARPTWFYPALWVSPLALLLALPLLLRQGGLAHEIAAGDWRRAGTWMIAALACGFFWELWNWHSAAKWIYTVPGVERWHLFEMPLLGYAGYLPFGLECLLVCEAAVGASRVPPHEAPASGGAGETLRMSRPG